MLVYSFLKCVAWNHIWESSDINLFTKVKILPPSSLYWRLCWSLKTAEIQVRLHCCQQAHSSLPPLAARWVDDLLRPNDYRCPPGSQQSSSSPSAEHCPSSDSEQRMTLCKYGYLLLPPHLFWKAKHLSQPAFLELSGTLKVGREQKLFTQTLF